RSPDASTGSRDRQVARAALGTEFGSPGIDVPGRTELHIVGRAAVLAEHRLAGCDAMTLVAIAHRILEERLRLVSCGPEPHRRPKGIAVNCFEGGEPEDLVCFSSHESAKIFQPPLRVQDHENPKLGITKEPCKFSGEGELEIELDLLLPNRQRFGSEIDLKEHRADSSWCFQFEISVG